MDIFRTKIADISERVDQVLLSDTFPDTIRPDCLREAVRYYPLRGGKKMRPALLLWSCGLLGGDPEDALFAASAVEVNHNWTLVHDDIIDRDSTRRGADSQHVSFAGFAEKNLSLPENAARRFGANFAILTGDIQQAWSLHLMMRSVESGLQEKLVMFLCQRMLELGGRELVSGEALDILFAALPPEKTTRREILEMLRLKTGALFRFSVEAGGLIALARRNHGKDPAELLESEEVGALAKFAEHAGVAFQLKDDWLGLFGEEKNTGKPVGSDFCESKPTVMTAAALESLDKAGKERLIGFFGKNELSRSDIDDVKTIIEDCGAAHKILDEAREMTSQARSSLRIFPGSDCKRLLLQWLDFIVGRDM